MADFDARVLKLFSRGESFDAEGFASLFLEAPIYQFGNAAPALDRASIATATAAFFGLLDALYHDIKTIQTVGDTAFVEMDVHYWRKNAGLIVLPCLDLLRFERGVVAELRIGMDSAAVSDSSVPIPAGASVFIGPGAVALPHPHPMRRYYVDDEDGRARVAQGRAPLWSFDGPRWPT